MYLFHTSLFLIFGNKVSIEIISNAIENFLDFKNKNNNFIKW
jgi:hypothetical protein